MSLIAGAGFGQCSLDLLGSKSTGRKTVVFEDSG